MSKALRPPTMLNPDDTGLNAPLNDIQQMLGRIEWLSYSLGRVVPQSVNGKLEPWVYAGAGEYYPAYPNDTLPSVSCLYAHEDEAGDKTSILFTRTVSIIVWMNQETLAQQRESKVFSMEMAKLDVRSALRNVASVLTIGRSYDQTATGPSAVWPGFDLSGLEGRYLTYPFAGFRIETTVGYADLCVY